MRNFTASYVGCKPMLLWIYSYLKQLLAQCDNTLHQASYRIATNDFCTEFTRSDRGKARLLWADCSDGDPSIPLPLSPLTQVSLQDIQNLSIGFHNFSVKNMSSGTVDSLELNEIELDFSRHTKVSMETRSCGKRMLPGKTVKWDQEAAQPIYTH